jgi:hypothetical protein
MKNTKPALLLALSASAFAQSPPVKPGHVDGTVTNARTGAPIANILVTLEGKKRYGARTSSDGKFSWDSIEPGEYQFTATSRGYLSDVQRISVRSEDAVHDRNLKILPEGVLSGHVLDENGDPMENVTVQAMSDSGDFVIGSDTTDDRGEFRISTPISKCRVRAVPREMPMPEEIRSDGTHETAYRATYFPGVPNAEAAVWVEMEPGGERNGIDIHLLPVPILRVSGTVDGIPPGADNVWVYFRSDDIDPHQAAVKNGKFTAWRLAPGNYIVNAGARGGDARTYTTVSQEIDLVKDSIDNLRFELVPEFDVSGRIQWDGTPASGDLSKTPEVRFESHDDWMRQPDKPLSGAVTADLAFRISKVTVGTYEVALQALPENVWVKSIMVDGQESPHPWLELRGAPETVTLLLGTAKGQVSGTVEGKKGPAAGVQVYLTPERAFGWILERNQKSAADGKYSFEGVPPGKYTVSIGREIHRGHLTMFEHTSSDSEEKASVDVPEGGRVARNLKAKD